MKTRREQTDGGGTAIYLAFIVAAVWALIGDDIDPEAIQEWLLRFGTDVLEAEAQAQGFDQ